MLTFLDFNSLNFPGFLSHSDTILASSIPHARQFPYCSSYNEARRVQTIDQISTWKVVLLEKIFIMKNLSDFRKSVETGVDPRLT